MQAVDDDNLRSDHANASMREIEADLRDGYAMSARRAVIDYGQDIAQQLRSEGDDLGLRRLQSIARWAGIDPATLNRSPDRTPSRKLAERHLNQLEGSAAEADGGDQGMLAFGWRYLEVGVTAWIEHSGDEGFRMRLAAVAAQLPPDDAPTAGRTARG